FVHGNQNAAPSCSFGQWRNRRARRHGRSACAKFGEQSTKIIRSPVRATQKRRVMRRNSRRIASSAAGLLLTFLVCSSYAAKSSRSSGGDDSPITVVIDAGHGGHDRGGIPGQKVAEKDMTLDVALRLRNILSASGYNVVMT